MKGTFLDFLQLLNENEDLRRDVVQVANKHGFEFTDQVSDAELEAAVGGATLATTSSDLEGLDTRQMTETAFQNFDQKSNQIYNLLASVMKATNDMQAGTTRNML